jgi:hypothetical protein
LAGERGVEIELLEAHAAVVDHAAGQHLEPLEQLLGLRPAVGFHHADHHVEPLCPLGARGFQHGEGLPDAR